MNFEQECATTCGIVALIAIICCGVLMYRSNVLKDQIVTLEREVRLVRLENALDAEIE